MAAMAAGAAAEAARAVVAKVVAATAAVAMAAVEPAVVARAVGAKVVAATAVAAMMWLSTPQWTLLMPPLMTLPSTPIVVSLTLHLPPQDARARSQRAAVASAMPYCPRPARHATRAPP